MKGLKGGEAYNRNLGKYSAEELSVGKQGRLAAASSPGRSQLPDESLSGLGSHGLAWRGTGRWPEIRIEHRTRRGRPRQSEEC